ncbi:Phytanoyl-CoA hydroxylase-interacting protein-like [Lamellibrachia satsuma]|nr:Phytanoyl-CoA hydroxylase-interacting protein-like [Lamellibrachia satsuma]
MAHSLAHPLHTPTMRAEFTPEELDTLHGMAVNHVKRGGCNEFNHCRVFYRNKPPDYFSRCKINDNNIMKVYMKDNNGDPKSIINGRIKGLFFATSVDSLTGGPPNISHFGSQRISIPATAMLTEYSNLYFADFYCNRRAHYVTVVLTKPWSETDQFCKRKLIKLDTRDNDFLWRNDKVYVTDNVWVEVLYTEDVDLSRPDCSFSTVLSTGTSTPGGLPKNPRCLVCNLPSTTPRRGGGDDGFDALAALIRKLGL